MSQTNATKATAFSFLLNLYFIVFVIFLGAIPGKSMGQIGCTVNSLDSLVAQSDLIFMGTIDSYVLSAQCKEAMQAKHASGRYPVQIKVKIKEVIRGKSEKEILLESDADIFKVGENLRLDGSLLFKEWSEAATEFLFFVKLNESKETNNENAILDYDFNRLEMARLGNAVKAEEEQEKRSQIKQRLKPFLITSRFEFLEDSNSIVEAAREIAKREFPNPLKFDSLSVPHRVVTLAGRYGDATSARFPVDSVLEQTCRQLAIDPQQVSLAKHKELGSYITSPSDRANAIGIIKRNFRNDKNIELMKSLLEDKTVDKKRTGDSGEEYPVRRAAWETLVAWDVYQQDGPEKPILEPATRNDK